MTDPSATSAPFAASEKLGAVLVFGSAFFWSFGGAIARFLEIPDSWTIVFWRCLFAGLFLLAFFVYNDGIQTMIKMAAIYGDTIGLDSGAMITALLLTQFIGVPAAFGFGALADRIGARPAVFLGLGVYTLIAALGYYMSTAVHFFALAVLVGLVQGGTQALSRSLFASMIPRHKSSEFFGFFSVFEKFAGIFGPVLFGLAIRFFGSSRAAILSVIVFFAAGAFFLTRVNVAEGEAEAAAATPPAG